MDTDEVILDWGAHNDDGVQVHSQGPSGIVGQEGIVAKDAAILSGAESLLTLASGGIDAQDDKDSDVVSLGGGEDDMEELYAYQSRMHLGDVVSGDPKLDVSVLPQSSANEESNSDDRKPTKSLATSTSPAASKDSKNLSNDPDTSIPHIKPISPRNHSLPNRFALRRPPGLLHVQVHLDCHQSLLQRQCRRITTRTRTRTAAAQLPRTTTEQ